MKLIEDMLIGFSFANLILGGTAWDWQPPEKISICGAQITFGLLLLYIAGMINANRSDRKRKKVNQTFSR